MNPTFFLFGKVIKGRGFEGKGNKPAIPYDDDSYPDFPAHFDQDTVRLGCLNGFSNGVAKPFVGSICTCANGTCEFEVFQNRCIFFFIKKLILAGKSRLRLP